MKSTLIKTVFLITAVMIFLGTSFKAKCDIDAWPLYEASENSTTILYPLHVREDDFKMNFPVYYQTNGGRDTHYLWPLIKLSDGKLERLAPIYFKHGEDDYTIFPIMHRKDGKSWWLIPPMYLGENTKLILPVYYKRDDQTINANMY